VNRERPCRTLFIRNIKYETSSDEVRGKFEDHGDVKTFFDLIGSRGMVFVTYVRARCCENAVRTADGRASSLIFVRRSGLVSAYKVPRLPVVLWALLFH
jgi:RNA recognition motif-containing protein